MTEWTETGMRSGGIVEAKGEERLAKVEVASAMSSEGYMTVLLRINERLMVMSPDQAAALSKALSDCATHAVAYMGGPMGRG